MKSFNGKVAAITGAGSGMGRSLALNLAAQGCHLALSDVSEAGLAETVALLKSSTVKITHQLLNVADQQGVFAWADTVVRDHGKVNLIFNNAGVALSGTAQALSVKDYEWIMNINFWGVVYGSKAFLPYLEASGEGHIVNTSSVFGLTAQPFMSGYNASKFAVRGYTESLRQDLDLSNSCVSATSVHPGGIKTNVAKAARMSDSVAEVMGRPNQEVTREFELGFITTADKAASVILNAVKRNKRRVLIGPDAYAYDGIVRLFPSAYQRIFVGFMRWRKKK